MPDIELQQNTKPCIIGNLRFFRGCIFAILFSIFVFLAEVLVISVVIKFIFDFTFRHAVLNTFVVLTLLYIIGVFIFIGYFLKQEARNNF